MFYHGFTRVETDLIFDTIQYIRAAHADQTYAGSPYYLHPIEVAETIVNPTFDEYIAALLHDVLEDTPITEEIMRKMVGGGNDERGRAITDMVVLCTKVKGLTYAENIDRIIKSGNKGAMRIKLADNKVNLRNGPKEHNIEKYKKSIAALTVALNK